MPSSKANSRVFVKVYYDAPVVITYSIIAIAVQFVNQLIIHGFINEYFFLRPLLEFRVPLDYFRLVTYIFGHANWAHLFENIILILLLGPIVEEKYGSLTLLCMITFTALSTGTVAVLAFSKGLFGSSGIAFMLIIMVSSINVRKHTLPASFILLVAIFAIVEFFNSFGEDNISQTAHIIGGILGAFFGLMFDTRKRITSLTYSGWKG